MIWVWSILGSLVGLVAIMVLVGYALPVGHRASRKIRLPMSAAEVWEILVDFASHPTWRRSLKEIEQIPDPEGKEVWKEKTSDGDLTLEITEAIPPYRLVRRIVNKDLPFGGEWVFELIELNGECVLTITENGEVYNPLFRFLSRFAFGHTGSINDFLTSLAAKCGTSNVPEDV